ncbi:MAG: DUF1080 domain-containing protein [Phycisphaeraceae bacterium]|nr:DUF1080 domain-containing protein [Phycisphaeraceae bacterium]MCW5762529.1 DUF1080 domain-containing protein [Phycisphaeraceae bacterium]
MMRNWMRLILTAALGLAIGLPSDAGSATGDGEALAGRWIDPSHIWKPLFDGQSLKGWVQVGEEGAWAVQDGEIVVAKPGKGWWLRTAKMYRDVDLRLEFWLPPGANSGVGIRGSSVGDPAFTGFEVQVFDSFGKEPTVQHCGAVYNAIAPTKQAVKPAGEWNSMRIRVVRDTLDVWLNGEQIHTAQKLDERGHHHRVEDAMPLKDRLTTGYIALQDHGHAVRYRKIEVRDLSPDPEPEGLDGGGYESLFNGRDTSGWFKTGIARWEVVEGTLVGRDGPGHLFSEREFGDFELRALVKVNRRGNSGIYFRTVPNAQNRDSWPTGYEAQVDNHDPRNFTGSVYNKAWPKATLPVTRDDAWFDYRILAIGNRIQTWINGVAMVDAELEEFSRGHIALQGHHPGNEIMYRDVRIREIVPASAEPKAE